MEKTKHPLRAALQWELSVQLWFEALRREIRDHPFKGGGTT